jgi:hypothetical protein
VRLPSDPGQAAGADGGDDADEDAYGRDEDHARFGEHATPESTSLALWPRSKIGGAVRASTCRGGEGTRAGREQDFEQAIRNLDRDYAGMRRFTAIKTGDRSYCMIGEWDSMDAILAARPQMIKSLDSFRHMLEDLGGGLGVTDAVSGEAVVELAARK